MWPTSLRATSARWPCTSQEERASQDQGSIKQQASPSSFDPGAI